MSFQVIFMALTYNFFAISHTLTLLQSHLMEWLWREEFLDRGVKKDEENSFDKKIKRDLVGRVFKFVWKKWVI